MKNKMRNRNYIWFWPLKSHNYYKIVLTMFLLLQNWKSNTIFLASSQGLLKSKKYKSRQF
jgi:hypothetical protein